jgi:site-specific DNA-methyltransferase (adenine-specific)
MAAVGSGEARLVLTSPPYFGPDVERLLSGPRAAQHEVAATWERVAAFARGFTAVFREMARVVGRTGVCCIETKDLAFGEFRLPLAALHAEMAREQGLWVRSSVVVRTHGIKPSHLPSFFTQPMVGNFRALDYSTLLICSHPDWRRGESNSLEIPKAKRLELLSPWWRVSPARKRRLHAHQSAPEMIRRVLELFTVPGELVVDPFAGSGQTIRMAYEMGRAAIGYETDSVRHAVAVADLVAGGQRARRVRWWTR